MSVLKDHRFAAVLRQGGKQKGEYHYNILAFTLVPFGIAPLKYLYH